MVRRIISCCFGCAVFAAISLVTSPVRAELIAFSATVESRTDVNPGSAVSSNERAFEAFPGTSNRLPIEATTALTQALDDDVIAQGRGLAVFDEPLFDEPPIGQFGSNPGEIGVSAAAFSEPASVSYTVRCTVAETRDFSFTQDNTNRPAGELLELRSALFPLGGLVIWGPAGTPDLTGATVDATVTIFRRAGTSADDETLELLTYHARLEGQSDGTVVATLEAIVNGEAVSLSADVIAPAGVLTGSSGGQLDLPDVPIEYTYLATVDEAGSSDEQFRLEAIVEVVCNNGSGGGIGAAAVLGAPLFEGSRARGGSGDDDDSDGGDSDDGDDDDESDLSKLITDVATGVAPPPPTVETSTTPLLGALGNLCGTLGAEAGLMFLFMGVVACVRTPLSRRSR